MVADEILYQYQQATSNSGITADIECKEYSM